MYLKIILEHFVKSGWLTWDSFEEMIISFPYRRKDANSRPAVLRGKKMKIKGTRKVIGTFRLVFSKCLTDSTG